MDLSQIILLIGGLITAIGGTAAVVDKRRRDLTDIWKGLYEARTQELKDRTGEFEEYKAEQMQRMSRLEAKVELLESNFIRQVARGVAEAVKGFIDEP